MRDLYSVARCALALAAILLLAVASSDDVHASCWPRAHPSQGQTTECTTVAEASTWISQVGQAYQTHCSNIYHPSASTATLGEQVTQVEWYQMQVFIQKWYCSPQQNPPGAVYNARGPLSNTGCNAAEPPLTSSDGWVGYEPSGPTCLAGCEYAFDGETFSQIVMGSEVRHYGTYQNNGNWCAVPATPPDPPPPCDSITGLCITDNDPPTVCNGDTCVEYPPPDTCVENGGSVVCSGEDPPPTPPDPPIPPGTPPVDPPPIPPVTIINNNNGGPTYITNVFNPPPPGTPPPGTCTTPGGCGDPPVPPGTCTDPSGCGGNPPGTCANPAGCPTDGGDLPAPGTPPLSPVPPGTCMDPAGCEGSGPEPVPPGTCTHPDGCGQPPAPPGTCTNPNGCDNGGGGGGGGGNDPPGSCSDPNGCQGGPPGTCTDPDGCDGDGNGPNTPPGNCTRPGGCGTDGTCDPATEQCGEDGAASGGVACDAAPSCSGDQILCNSLFQIWQTKCAAKDIADALDTENLESELTLDGLNVGPDDAEADGLFAQPLEDMELDDTGLGWNRSCPAPVVTEYLGNAVVVGWAPICDNIDVVRFMVMLFASFAAVGIIAGRQ